MFCVFTQTLRATPRLHCRAPQRLPLPLSHCNANTATEQLIVLSPRTADLTRHMLSQLNVAVKAMSPFQAFGIAVSAMIV